MRICTWNSQGDPTNNTMKKIVLTNLYRRNDVVLIQECGAMAHLNTLLPGCCRVIVPQAGAFNNRCSTCILSEYPFSYTLQTLPSANGRSLIIATFQHTAIRVLTMHATAGNGGADVFPALQHTNSPFILGADMNCTPDFLSGNHSEKTRTLRVDPRHHVNAYFSAPPYNTHPSTNQTLDFFIFSPDLICANTDTYSSRGGDHFPVETEVRFRYRGG